jgi:hypothetical protein
MKTAILAFLLSVAPVHATPKSLDYWGRLSTASEARRHALHRFYCTVQMELAEREIMRGRWVSNPRCW